MQDYKKQSIRDAAILTGSYVPGDVLGTTLETQLTYENNQLVLFVDFTIGSLTTAEIKVEFSADNSNFYQESYDDIAASTGVITQRLITRQLGATGKYRIAIPIKDRYIKVSAKGTGTVTSSSLAILGIIATV